MPLCAVKAPRARGGGLVGLWARIHLPEPGTVVIQILFLTKDI